MNIKKVRTPNDWEEIKRKKAAFIYWKSPSNFEKIMLVFGTLLGKVEDIVLSPINNWRQFKALVNKKDKVYVLADSNTLQTAVLNGNDKVEIIVDLTDLNINEIPSEINVVRQEPKAYFETHQDAVFLAHSQSIDAFQRLVNIPRENKRYFTSVNEAKFLMSSKNAVLLYSSDVSVKRVIYSALFRPIETITVIVPPTKTTNVNETTVQKVESITDIFE